MGFFMSEWPPKPEEKQQSSSNNIQQPTGNEWKILEKAVLSSVEEQRRARRWGIFFKFLTFAYLLFIIIAMAKSCSMSSSDPAATAGSHIAVVDIIGTIAADKQSVNSANTIKALKKATKLNDKEVYAALGWLAREGKVEITKQEKDVFVCLK